jgi:hypothetical protein
VVANAEAPIIDINKRATNVTQIRNFDVFICRLSKCLKRKTDLNNNRAKRKSKVAI